MQQLVVPYLSLAKLEKKSFASLSGCLDSLPRHLIKEVPWPAFPFQPKVCFSMAHTGDTILLKYYVTEPFLRCVNTQVNTPVYEDSCVEFFIAFDERGYYNLEFNCIGTALVGYGSCKNERTLLDAALVKQVLYEAKLSNSEEGNYNWELMLMIPLQLFTFHSIDVLNGLQCRANFYKCADLSAQPHFLSWTPIRAPEPDFHLPRFFGALLFQ